MGIQEYLLIIKMTACVVWLVGPAIWMVFGVVVVVLIEILNAKIKKKKNDFLTNNTFFIN